MLRHSWTGEEPRILFAREDQRTNAKLAVRAVINTGGSRSWKTASKAGDPTGRDLTARESDCQLPLSRELCGERESQQLGQGAGQRQTEA